MFVPGGTEAGATQGPRFFVPGTAAASQVACSPPSSALMTVACPLRSVPPECCTPLSSRRVVQLRALQVSARASRVHIRLLGMAVQQGRILRWMASQPPTSAAGLMRCRPDR